MSLLDLETEFYKAINSIVKNPHTYYRMTRLDKITSRLNTLGKDRSMITPVELMSGIFQHLDPDKLEAIGKKTGKAIADGLLYEYALELEQLKPVKQAKLICSLATIKGWGEFRLRKLKPDKNYIIVEVINPIEKEMPFKRRYAFTSGFLNGMFSRILHHNMHFEHKQSKDDSHHFISKNK